MIENIGSIPLTQGDSPVDIKIQEQQITKIIIDEEYKIGIQNVQLKISDFESAIDMLECERREKNADWMSDIFFPEFTAQILTQSSIEANQYFQTRDFVEVYIEDGSEQSLKAADANKELINRTLNQRHIYHFHKFMRANIIKNLGGEVYARCGWERKTAIRNIPQTRSIESDIDQFGNPIVDKFIQVPMIQQQTEIVPQEKIITDRFNYEILDRRNIFMDDSYVYSLQDKKWIIIREEKTLDELKSDAEIEGYTNLDSIKNPSDIRETETSRESYNKDDNFQKAPLKGNQLFDVVHRYGKFWAIVNSRDNNGDPQDISYGLDRNGNPLPDAQLVECIISIALIKSDKILIRFIPNKFKDADGQVYRPIIRGICYIHPTKDWGLGDGKCARELQVGINDTLNISNDRVMLATLPTLKGKKYAIEDNQSVFFQPNHTILLENPDDLVEFQISDNIQGSLNQIGMLRQAMSGVTSIFPPAIGSTPELASTTATAVAGAEQSKNMRSNYKALTFENTFLNEFYWMITQMTYQFATQDTAYKLMGDKMYDFNPSLNYTYKPLSQSIESEYSKINKIRELTQLIGFLAPSVQVNPKATTLINQMIAKIMNLFGDENQAFENALLDENAPMAPGNMVGASTPPVQNQNNTPMSGMESMTRGAMGGFTA